MLEPPPRPIIICTPYAFAIFAPAVMVSIVGFEITPSKWVTSIPLSVSIFFTLLYCSCRAGIAAGVVTRSAFIPYTFATSANSFIRPLPKSILVDW